MTSCVTTYPCDVCDGETLADHQPPAVDCDRSHCADTWDSCPTCRRQTRGVSL